MLFRSGPFTVFKTLRRLEEGRRDDALEAAEAIPTAFGGEVALLPIFGSSAAEALVEERRLDLVREIATPMESSWRYQAWLRHRLQGLIAEAEGRFEEAVGELEKSVAIADSLGHRYGVALAGVPLARVLGELGRAAEQDTLLDRIEPMSIDMGTQPLSDEIARLRGANEELAEAN